MASTISPNMNLIVPGVGTEPSPTWATDLNASLSSIDSHNHSSGQGVQITPSGLNINSDLTFQDNNATLLRSTRFQPQPSVLSLSTDVGCLYVVGNELYYNDVTGGHNVQITSNGMVNATSSGISSGTASAAFAAGVLVVKSSSTSGADILMQSAVLTNSGNLTNQLTLQAPALTSSYSLTLPYVPGSLSFVTLDASGNFGTSSNVSGAQIAASSITGSQIVNNVNLPGEAVQENGLNVVVSNTNATNSLAIVRGRVASNGTILSGEGFSVVNTGSGTYVLGYNSFADVPTVIVTPNEVGSVFACSDTTTVNQTSITTFDSGGFTSAQFGFIIIGQRA